MNKKLRGLAYVLGTNIDTDQIIPAEHLVYSMENPDEARLYGHFALSGVPAEGAGLPQGNTPFIAGDADRSEYSIIIASSNFGCGSSREHAPYALMKAGTKAIIALSYARIFYRNAVDGGFLVPIESGRDLSQLISTGDEVEIDLQAMTCLKMKTGEIFQLNDLGSVLPIVEAGGIFEYARKTGMIPESGGSAS